MDIKSNVFIGVVCIIFLFYPSLKRWLPLDKFETFLLLHLTRVISMRKSFCCCGMRTCPKILTFLLTFIHGSTWMKKATEVKAEFRFEQNDIPALHQVLRIPETFTCRQGTVCDRLTGLCTVLKRLTYPCRFSDMIPTFGTYNNMLTLLLLKGSLWGIVLASSMGLFILFADRKATKEQSKMVTKAYIVLSSSLWSC